MTFAFVAHLFLQGSYIILIPIIFIAQPAVALLSGVFIRLGYISFPLTYAYIVCVALTGDMLWYAIGYRYGESFTKRFGPHFGITERHVHTVTRLFHTYPNRILFISKITNGLGFAIVVLFSAGLARIPFRRYMLFNLIGEMAWTGSLIGIGYFFSHLYITVNNVLGRVSLFATFIITIVCVIAIAHYIRKKISEAMP